MSFDGKSAVGDIPLKSFLIGAIATLLASIGIIANGLVTRQLRQNGLGNFELLPFKYLIPSVVFAILYFTASVDFSMQNFIAILPIALFGMILPTYLGNLVMHHTHPLIIAAVFAMSPVLVLILQFFDGRLILSVPIIATMSAVCLLSIVSLVSQMKSSVK